MKVLLFVIGWCLLFVLSWPVALLAQVLAPLVWLLSLPGSARRAVRTTARCG